MPSLAERLAIIIDATGIGAISEFKKVGATAKKELGEVDKATQGTRTQSGLLAKGLDKLGLSSIDTGTALKTGAAAGATVAAAALVKFGRDSVSAFSSATAQVTAFKRIAGGTAEDASKLVFAMNALHIDTDAAARGFGILSKNIENTPSKLAAIGVQVAKNKDGTSDLTGTLFNVANAYNATKDQAEKNTIALTAFGKGGAALIPILARGKDGIKAIVDEAAKMHGVFSEADLQKGVEFRLATTKLSDAMHGLEIEAGGKLVPALTQVAGALTTLVEDADKVGNVIGKTYGEVDKLTGSNNHLRNALGGVVGVLNPVVGGVELAAAAHNHLHPAMGKVVDFAGQVNDALASQATLLGGLAGADGAPITSTKDLAAAQDKLNTALLGIPGAELAAEQALFSLKGDVSDLTDKQKAYNDALRDHGAKSAEAAAALRDLQGENLTLKGDLLQVAAAAADVAEKHKGSALTAQESAQTQIASLKQVEAQFPAMTPVIEGYIAELLKVPGTINTKLTLDEVNYYRAHGQNVPGDTTYGGAKTADGGVFNGAQVRVIGEAGPEAVVPLGSSSRATQSRMRVMRQAGLAWANGGIAGAAWGGGGVTNNYTVNVSPGVATHPAEVGQAVVDAIKEYERRSGSSWRSA